MEGKAKESLKVRFAYGVSSGPSMVAVQERRFPSAEGKADIPGAEEVISCINSVWRLLMLDLGEVGEERRGKVYTVWLWTGRRDLSLGLRVLLLGRLGGCLEPSFGCLPYRNSWLKGAGEEVRAYG